MGVVDRFMKRKMALCGSYLPIIRDAKEVQGLTCYHLEAFPGVRATALLLSQDHVL